MLLRWCPTSFALRPTLTGVSCLQMVDRMDQGAIPAQVVAQSYEALWKLVSKALYRTHVEGKLKVRLLSPDKVVRVAQHRICSHHSLDSFASCL